MALADCHTHNNEEVGYNCYWCPSGALNTLIQKYCTTHVCHLVIHGSIAHCCGGHASLSCKGRGWQDAVISCLWFCFCVCYGRLQIWRVVSVGAIGGNTSVHIWMVAIVTWMGRGTQLTVCVCAEERREG